MKALARTLAPRRVSVEDIAAAALTAMQEVAPEARPEWLAELFAVILGRINVERDEVMAGIGRYAKHQQALAERIDSLESDLATLEAAPEADKNMDRIEELQDELLWERRVFKERAQSLTYVCETPVLLEKRAFAIGRALSGLM